MFLGLWRHHSHLLLHLLALRPLLPPSPHVPVCAFNFHLPLSYKDVCNGTQASRAHIGHPGRFHLKIFNSHKQERFFQIRSHSQMTGIRMCMYQPIPHWTSSGAMGTGGRSWSCFRCGAGGGKDPHQPSPSETASRTRKMTPCIGLFTLWHLGLALGRFFDSEPAMGMQSSLCLLSFHL